jgi:lysyl-tRNA synthetase class 1
MKTPTNKSIYKSWPFRQAGNLLKRFKEAPNTTINFETGYGPSGLPHIGTFAEVARTTWVRNAFQYLTGWPTELIAFSDDMDGLRKVPPNLPKQKMLTENIGKPLCHIPDPYDQCESYSAYMNNKLQEFLDRYNFEYHFQSSQKAYAEGNFNEGLSILLRNTEKLKTIILPTLREKKRVGWSPFFPICERCGRINSTQVLEYHPEEGTIDYVCDKEGELLKSCGLKATATIFDGNVKVGWRTDWALRWYSYDINYEMYGKDLIDSAKLSGKIVRLMGKQPPTGFHTELFLDDEGKKISKSVGKGLTIDTWTDYAPLESLLYYVFQKPEQAKRLFWGMVPKTVDDYLTNLAGYADLDSGKQPDSTMWHIYGKGQAVPGYTSTITFSLINNLISALGTGDKNLVIEYLKRYDPSIEKEMVVMKDLVKKGMNYYQDYILPNKHYRTSTEKEAEMLRSLLDKLKNYGGNDANELQTLPFDVARAFDIEPRDFFKLFYQVIIGQEQGPRFGTFVGLVGKDKVIGLLNEIGGL